MARSHGGLKRASIGSALRRPGEDGVHAAVGYYAADAPGNLTTDRDAATIINLTRDITGIEITLP